MSEFKIGDTVTLKSGGPRMTVKDPSRDINGKPHVECRWFDKNDVWCMTHFLPDELRKMAE